MHIREEKLPRARELSRSRQELSRAALVRLAWMDFYRVRGRNVAFTCRHFGISRKTFYRWRQRFDPHNLHSFESGSHRPHHRRRPTWTAPWAGEVLCLRRRFPRWGKDKPVILLRRQGLRLSTSMVGRILSDLKRRGVLVEPLGSDIYAKLANGAA